MMGWIFGIGQRGVTALWIIWDILGTTKNRQPLVESTKNWSNSCGKHPGKMRWQWKYIHLTMYLLVKMVIFHLAMFVFRRQGFFLNSANINWQLLKSNCKYHYFTMMLKFPERFAMLPRFLPLTLSVWYCWWTIHPAKKLGSGDKITKKHRNTEYPKWFAT